MKHCKFCDVNVRTDKEYCPLCFNDISGEHDDNLLYLVNNKEMIYKKKYLASKILLFITFSVLMICGFINFMTYNGILWSVIVATSALYLWILVGHTIISSRNAFEKVFFQLFGIIGIVVSTNLVSGGGDWLANYVLPSISLLVVIVLGFILICNKKRKNLLVGFLVIYVLLIIMSIILLACKLDNFKLLNEINLITTGLSVLAILFFGFRTIKTELSRKLHL